jgi:hypothetical protein
MGILFGRPAVRRPAGVADAIRSVKRFEPYRLFEIAQLSLGAPQRKIVIFVNDGNARRIVTAIFQFPQAVDDQRHNLFIPNVSDNSAHSFF